ncbi:MAG: eCIS core domain-containing protein, partial [Solirubrobacteraceae bacterium]
MSEPTATTARQPVPAPDAVMRPQPAAHNHDQGPAHPLAELQRTLGNLGVVQRMADPALMPKLEVGAPDDRHEREADRVASAVMRQSDDLPNVSAASAQISRAPEDQREPTPTTLATKPTSTPKTPRATKTSRAAVPDKGSPSPVAGHGTGRSEPTKKAPVTPAAKAATEGHAAPGKAPGEHGKNPVTGKPPAASPLAGKGSAGAQHKAAEAARAAAKHPTKHPAVKPPPGAVKHAQQAHVPKPNAKPKTGTTAHDHPPGHPAPSPKHAGGPPKHIHEKPTQAPPSATSTSQTPTPERKPNEPVVAAKPATPGTVPTLTPAAARTISSSQGSGQPLSSTDRGFFESRLGRDLGGVRVHDNPAAHRAARDVRAKAFTYGEDVFFSPGRYQPGTGVGRELLAHELAHTIQQRPGAKLERSVQRQPDGGSGGGANQDPLKVGNIGVPAFRLQSKDNPYTGKLTRSAKYSADTRPDDQRDLWKGDLAPSLTGQVKTLIDSFTRRNYNPQSGDSGSTPVVLRSNAGGRFIAGSQQEMAAELTTPEWDRTGATSMGPKRGFQVDHILELQLSGYPDSDAGHKPSNLQLLRASVNASSGTLVDTGARNAVLDYLKTLPADQLADADRKLVDPASKPGGVPTVDDAKFTMRQHNIEFAGATAAGGPAAGPADIWDHGQISRGEHLGVTIGNAKKPAVEATTMTSANDKGFVAILPSASGGVPKKLSTSASPIGDESRKFAPYKLVNKSFNIGDDWRSQPMLGTLALEIPADHKTFTQASALIQVERYEGAQFAGHLQGRAGRGGSAAINDQMRGLGLKKASPIVIEDSGLGDQGFELSGYVQTDLTQLSGARMNLSVTGYTDELSKTFQ